MIISKTFLRLVPTIYSKYIQGRTLLPKVIIIQYEESEYLISYWRLELEGMTSITL